MPDRVPLSACIIALNEADRIGACIESLAFCDEIGHYAEGMHSRFTVTP